MSDAELSDSEESVKLEGGAGDAGAGGAGSGAGSAGAGAGAAAAKKKKNRKAKAKKSRDLAAFFERALKETAGQLEGVPPERLLKVPDTFGLFEFTGPLRPAYVTPMMRVPPHIPMPDHAEFGTPVAEEAETRLTSPHVYDKDEIERMRKVCAIGAEVLAIAGKFLRAGVTGDEIDRVVYTACVERGAYPSPLNYYRFPKSVCVSVNEVICHGIPDCRPIRDGDIVNIDVSIYYDGMHTDLNETFLVGNVDEEGRRLVKTAWECLQAACRAIKPGVFYRDIGHEIQKVADKAQMAVVKRYSGHGVGRLFHTSPTIPHYRGSKAVGVCRPGHIFTVEPMINLGGPGNSGDVTWPDNWTAVTRDGSRSAQFEHTFLVTETGVEILTARTGTSRTDMLWTREYEEILQRP